MTYERGMGLGLKLEILWCLLIKKKKKKPDIQTTYLVLTKKMVPSRKKCDAHLEFSGKRAFHSDSVIHVFS